MVSGVITLAEEHGNSKSDEDRKPSVRRTKKPTKGQNQTAADDAKFDAFLKEQFAELRSQLDRQISQGSAKAGKVVDLNSVREKRAAGTSVLTYFDKWKYGIAAAVIVAVAVPMVLQVNRQKAELAARTGAPTLEQNQQADRTLKDRIAEREEAGADADGVRPGSAGETGKSYYAKKPVAPVKDAREDRKSAEIKGIQDAVTEERNAPAETTTSRTEGYVSKEEARAPEQNQLEKAPAAGRSRETTSMAAAPADKEERSLSATAPSAGAAPSAPASPAPAPVFAAKKRSAAPMPEADNKRDAASADEAPAAKARSFSLDDANAKLKKQSIAEEEKAEMEKLWKEYEKDPQAFSKDKNRSARLRTLLARHDTKSRARRMRTVPAK